jgi:hypothetical protein
MENPLFQLTADLTETARRRQVKLFSRRRTVLSIGGASVLESEQSADL